MAGEHNGYSSAQMCPVGRTIFGQPCLFLTTNGRAHLISSPDLALAVRGQKIRGGGRGKESRKQDLAKYESKRALIGCSITDAKAPRVCYFFRSQCKKHAKEVL